jgi:Tol biopolymer transport system component
MNADGGNQRTLINDRAINTIPRWTRDASAIYFNRYEPGRTDRWGLYRIRPDGSGLTEVTHPTLGSGDCPSF